MSRASPTRCSWTGNNPLLIHYHDTEWGRPVHNDRKLFEMLILEGAQAGLSWLTILKMRPAYRKAFHRFDYRAVAGYGQRDIHRLLNTEGIVRNRRKIESSIGNAKAFLAVRKEFGSFNRYLWRFIGNAPQINSWPRVSRIPSRTEESDALSRDLVHRGFRFSGPTICYAFMQAVGMVNDHTRSCFLSAHRRPSRKTDRARR
jgi:DNA-3-methyladenine glycosylase I